MLCSPDDAVSSAVSCLLSKATAQSASICASTLFGGGARLLCGMAAGIEDGGDTYEKRCIAADLLLCAFPEWLAVQREGQPGRYQLRQGRGAILRPEDPLWGQTTLAVARLDLGGRDCRIQLALPLSSASLKALATEQAVWEDSVRWDEAQQRIQARRQLRLGQLVLREEAQPTPSSEHCRALIEFRRALVQRCAATDAINHTTES